MVDTSVGNVAVPKSAETAVAPVGFRLEPSKREGVEMDYFLTHTKHSPGKVVEPGTVPFPTCGEMTKITRKLALEKVARVAKDIERQAIQLGKDSIKFLKEHKKALKDYYKFLEKYDHTFEEK